MREGRGGTPRAWCGARERERASLRTLTGAPRSYSQGLWRDTKMLALTRWRPELPSTPDNLVMLTKKEADAHDAFGPGAADHIRRTEPELYDKVERCLGEARCMFRDGWAWEGGAGVQR